MTVHRGIAVTTLATIFLTLCAPLFATAAQQPVLSKDEAKCRKELSKDLGKMVKLTNKAFAKCHKDQQNNKLPSGADCNSLSDPNVDPKGKVAKIEAKVATGVAKKCGSLSNNVLSRYISCPVDPCAGVINNPMQSYSELASCLVCVSESGTSTRSSALLGSANPPPTGAAAKCSQSVAKGYGKLVDTTIKDRTKCQGLADKFATTDIDNDVDRHCEITGRSCSVDADCEPSLAGSKCVGCVAADGKGKIAKAKTKAESLFDGACVGDTTGIFPCGGTDPVAAKACLAAAAESQGDEAVLAGYKMDATICPVGLQNLIFAGDGVGEDLTTFVHSRTSLEVGWTGIAHPQDLPDRYAIDVDLSCGASSTPCGVCSISGVDTTSPSAAYRMRCRDDKSIPCTMPFQTDTACPSNGFCSYFLSGPLPLNAANNPVCVYNRLDSDVSGSADIETGAGLLSLVPLFSTVATGESQTRPCPICGGKCIAPVTGSAFGNGCVSDSECDSSSGVGDGLCDLTTEKANDNQKDGVCLGGIDNGSPCDVQSFDRTFEPVLGTGTSLDCRQSLAADIGSLKLSLDLTTGTSTLPFGTDCEGSFGTAGFKCACALCSGDKSVACNSDAECANIGAGLCNANTTAGATRQPNNCQSDGFLCTDTGDGINGVCASDADTFCDGILRGNGEGFLFCGSNADCDAIAAQCGGDCGNCAATSPRRCFLDPIVATGAPDPKDPLLVSTFCLPPTVADSINLASGTPGPARVRIDSHVTKKY